MNLKMEPLKDEKNSTNSSIRGLSLKVLSLIQDLQDQHLFLLTASILICPPTVYCIATVYMCNGYCV